MLSNAHELPVYVRAYTEPVDAEPPDRPRRSKPDWPEHWLAFDTETTTDPTQALLFGSFRVGSWDEDGRPVTLGEGLFYSDDLQERSPEGLETLEQYLASHFANVSDHPSADPGFRLLSREKFIREVLWPFAWDLKALVVGFNLPFDLTRVAADARPARGTVYNGFSLPLVQYRDRESGSRRDHPHVGRFRIKTIDSKRALLGLTRPQHASEGKSFRGRLLDLRTLAFALTNVSHSLASACEEFDAEQEPQEADSHGEITPEYIDYNRRDVRATVALLAELREEYDRHPIPAPPDDLLSPASISKAYLDAMGIEPPRAKFDLPKCVHGWGMCAFYGGRAEVKVRRSEVPVVYLDFKSMYPTVNALMDMGDLLRADDLRLEEATDEVQEFLEDVTLEDYFDPDLWPDLRFLAKIRPRGDMLPVRSQYDPESQNRNIGVNPVKSEEAIIYAGPDLIASKLLTGRAPTVLEAYRLVPEDVQDGLESVELRGEVEIDPRTEDIFRRIIEHRKDPERAGSQPEEGQEDRLGDFLKVLANSGSYGIFAEMVRHVRPDDSPEKIEIYDRDDHWTDERSTPEEPGAFCFPAVAALIASAARLMLAMLERCVRDRGGQFVFCDTDSMAVVASEDGGLIPCPGGEHELPDGSEAIRALSWETVEVIIERFEQLKPYDSAKVPGELLEVEDENYRDADSSDERIQLHCFAVSTKRYALVRYDDSE